MDLFHCTALMGSLPLSWRGIRGRWHRKVLGPWRSSKILFFWSDTGCSSPCTYREQLCKPTNTSIQGRVKESFCCSYHIHYRHLFVYVSIFVTTSVAFISVTFRYLLLVPSTHWMLFPFHCFASMQTLAYFLGQFPKINSRKKEGNRNCLGGSQQLLPYEYPPWDCLPLMFLTPVSYHLRHHLWFFTTSCLNCPAFSRIST